MNEDVYIYICHIHLIKHGDSENLILYSFQGYTVSRATGLKVW